MNGDVFIVSNIKIRADRNLRLILHHGTPNVYLGQRKLDKVNLSETRLRDHSFWPRVYPPVNVSAFLTLFVLDRDYFDFFVPILNHSHHQIVPFKKEGQKYNKMCKNIITQKLWLV